jgi:predicted RecA/RadA family phage recombinase
MKIRTITVAMLLIAVLGTMLVMPATAATATRTLPSDCVNAGEDFTVTRTLPGDCVNAGEDFTVTIEADNYGSFGAVIETLCADWEYQSTTADDVQVDGNTISFLLVGSGPKTFTYTVSAPDATGTCCNISGIIRDDDTHDYTVTGATEVCVCEPTATRTLPSDCVIAGAEFTVAITADNYGSVGAVIEVICDGWTYQNTTADDAILIDANTISFPLTESGPSTFTYTVLAPNAPDSCCVIGGILRDETGANHGVTGDCEVCTCTELNWWDEWMGPDSEEGSTVTTTELQAAIHHWLEDIPVRGHVMSTPDFQWIIAEWLSG